MYESTSPKTEAKRLAAMTPPQARAVLNDRISRTFLHETSDPNAFKHGLAFNAQLCTELGAAFPTLWR